MLNPNPRKILLFGAGGPAGVNFARAATMAGHTVIGVEANPMHVYFASESCETVLLQPRLWSSEFWAWYAEVIERYEIDLIHSQVEEICAVLSADIYVVGKSWLPKQETVLRTQDKYMTCNTWFDQGLRSRRPFIVNSPTQLMAAADVLGYPMWLRAQHGAGARGAICAGDYETAKAWLSYWMSSRETPLIAEEYLPGRDYGWASIWVQGEPIAWQTRERLEYIYPHLAPSGRTGTPVAAAARDDEGVVQMGYDAVRAIDKDATGIFCVDIREDAEGIPCPTEINAGRFYTTSSFYAAAEQSFGVRANLVDIYIDAAFGLYPDEAIANPIPDGTLWLRHIDSQAVLTDEEDIEHVNLHGSIERSI